MRFATKWLMIMVFSLLTACGYHLRGTIELPETLKKMHLFGASATLQTEVTSLLRSSKGKLVESPNDAGVVVKILKEDFRRRVLSLGSTGKSSEYELQYYLRFQFYDNQEKPLLDEQTIDINRDYFNNQSSAALLAKDAEEAVIRQEMYKQAARMLLARAQVAVEHAKK